MAAQRMFAGATGFTLLAVPFFVLAGILMNTGGITERIFRFAQAISGHWWGGLGQVNVIDSVIFAGMSGTAISDAAGIGAMEIKAMKDAGYDGEFSATITAVSASIGPMLPPSVPLVIYASITNTSVGALFMGGILPGLIMALGVMIVIYFVAKKRNYPRSKRATVKIFFKCLVEAIPALICPLLLLGGLFSGAFTPTESGVIACVYALILSLLYKEVKLKDLPDIFWQAIKQSANILFIIALASFFAWVLNYMRIPQAIISSLTVFVEYPILLMLIILAAYIVLGCFIEGTAIMYMALPVFVPLMVQMDYNLIQFGIVTVLAMMIGLICPPIGEILFVVAQIADVEYSKLTREVMWYVVAFIAALLLVAFIPQISLFLPGLMGYTSY
jgi:tripartite ATP-independent transporter DctM subunit